MNKLAGASRKGLKAQMEDQIIEGKSRREQRPQRSSQRAPQLSSSFSFNSSNNVTGDSRTDAITTRKNDKAEGTVKQRKGSRIGAKKVHKSDLKKAKKILKKTALEVAEKRREIKYMKQSQMEEAEAMEAVAKEIKSKLVLMRATIRIEFLKYICIQLLFDVMLQVFEAEELILRS